MDNSFPDDLQVSGELLYLYFVKALIVNVISANPTNANTLSNFGCGYNRFIISNFLDEHKFNQISLWNQTKKNCTSHRRSRPSR